MQKPLRVSFHDLPVSAPVEEACHAEAAKLEHHSDRIISCEVVIAEPHRSHRSGNHFDIRIVVHVPGQTLVVNREPHHQQAEDVHIALRDAFHRMRRQLDEYAQRRRGQVKAHERPEPSDRG